jgi:hypothetical protein
METFTPVNATEPPLTKEETAAAVGELYKREPFRIANRNLVDPLRPTDPRYFIFSFIKAPGAIADPDSKILGVAKVRGMGYTVEEMDARARELIENVDSTNSIFTGVCGMPFPLVDSGFASEVIEVDLSKQTEKIISDNVRAKRNAAEKEMREIEERRNRLVNKDGSLNEPNVEPLDIYIGERSKLAQLKFEINEYIKKIQERRDVLKTVKEYVLRMESENADFKEKFVERYKQSRRAVGIPEDTDFSGFMTFLLDDAERAEEVIAKFKDS